MKELELKINDLIFEYTYIDWVPNGGEPYIEGEAKASEVIAQEIKDIAIGFAEHWENHRNAVSIGWESPYTHEEVFNQYIKENTSHDHKVRSIPRRIN